MENVASVGAAGARAFAVLSAVADAPDPVRAVVDLAERFGNAGC